MKLLKKSIILFFLSSVFFGCSEDNISPTESSCQLQDLTYYSDITYENDKIKSLQTKNNQTITFNYNSNNLLVSRIYSDDSANEFYFYNTAGLLERIEQYDHGTIYRKSFIIYNDKNQIMEVNDHVWERLAQELRFSGKYQLVWNDQGNIIRINTFDSNDEGENLFQSAYTDLEYDQMNNYSKSTGPFLFGFISSLINGNLCSNNLIKAETKNMVGDQVSTYEYSYQYNNQKYPNSLSYLSTEYGPYGAVNSGDWDLNYSNCSN